MHLNEKRERRAHPEVAAKVKEALETIDRVIASTRANKAKAAEIASTAGELARAAAK